MFLSLKKKEFIISRLLPLPGVYIKYFVYYYPGIYKIFCTLLYPTPTVHTPPPTHLCF